MGRTFRKNSELGLLGWAKGLFKSGNELPTGNYGGFMRALSGWFSPGSSINYRKEVGLLHLNEVVFPAINYKYRAILAPTLILNEWSEKEQKWVRTESVRAKDAIRPLMHQSAVTSFSQVLHRLLVGYDTVGNVFFYKVRSAAGKVVWLQHIDPSRIVSSNTRDLNKAITHWEVTTLAGMQEIEIQDIVHIKFGADPESEVYGISPLASAMKSIYSVNAASDWNASTLRNQGKPSAIVSPKPLENLGEIQDFSQQTAEYLGRFTADKRGEMAWLPLPIDIQVPGWKPTDLELLALSRMNRETILSHLGVPAEVLAWETANKTYNNAEAADDSVGKRTILPMLSDWAEQLSYALLKDMGLNPESYQYAFDTTKVWWLADEEDKVQLRHRENFKVGGMSLASFKLKINEVPDKGDEKKTYFDLVRKPVPENPIGTKSISQSGFQKRTTTTYDAQSDHDRTIKRGKTRLQKIANQFGNNEIKADEFKEEFSKVLLNLHKDLYRIGQKHAGIDVDNEQAEIVAQQIVDLEQQFLAGFSDDLAGLLYRDDDGNFRSDSAALNQRVQWYASKASSTASTAWVDAQDADEEFDWNLGGAEDHCQDCPYLASNSPYTKDTLSTKPRECQTPCGGSCTCYLTKRSDGQTGFKPTNW